MTIFQMLVSWVAESPENRDFIVQTQRDPFGNQEVWVELYDDANGQKLLSSALGRANEEDGLKALREKIGQLETVDISLIQQPKVERTTES